VAVVETRNRRCVDEFMLSKAMISTVPEVAEDVPEEVAECCALGMIGRRRDFSVSNRECATKKSHVVWW
jgi:hypothetical protein